MVTVGRVAFAALRRPSSTAIYHGLPFLLAAALALIAALPAGSAPAGIVAFGLAGLGCSALLPLTISFGEAQLGSMGAGAAGAIIASYQLGYGIAAFGTGPLQSNGVSLPALFAMAAIVALVLGACSFAVTTTTVRARASTSPPHQVAT
jgi:hypothetical protein